jgi:hypothetical protein
MRSNTVKNVRDILEDDYDVNRLITEALN